MVKNSAIDAMKVNGNALCLNFLNTISHRFKSPVRSYFTDAGDIIYWAWKKVGILTEEQALRLEQEAASDPARAQEFYLETLKLRSALDGIFFPLSGNEEAGAPELKIFNDIRHAYCKRQRITPSGDTYALAWDWAPGDFEQITAPIITSAQELLLSPRLHRIGRCDRCGWLFLDITKNGKRRWCSMEDCGSAEKAKEYYHRHKPGG